MTLSKYKWHYYSTLPGFSYNTPKQTLAVIICSDGVFEGRVSLSNIYIQSESVFVCIQAIEDYIIEVNKNSIKWLSSLTGGGQDDFV